MTNYPDYPTAEQLEKSLRDVPKRKISVAEQKRIDNFVTAVRKRSKSILKSQENGKK